MLQLKVSGMTCGHCVRAVTGAVKGVVPDAQVNVSLETGTVTVSGEAHIPADKVASAIAEEGYEVTPLAA